MLCLVFISYYFVTISDDNRNITDSLNIYSPNSDTSCPKNIPPLLQLKVGVKQVFSG